MICAINFIFLYESAQVNNIEQINKNEMKFKTTLFLILNLFVVFSIASCSQSASSNKEKDNQTELATNSSSEGEDFKSFLEEFNHMPTFQRQRVLFPVEATVLDPSEYGMKAVQEMIDYQDWFLLDFSYDSTYRTRQMDRYDQNIRLYEDSALIEHRGIDNGIYSNYLFTKKNGKWFLKSFTDVSY